MKKKIILFLSFLMIAVCLTGCSEKPIQGSELEKMEEIANHVANEKGYVLPEGYTVSYPDNTTNARIRIRDNTRSQTEILYVIFDISTEEIKLVEISVYSVLGGQIFTYFLFSAVALAAIYLIIKFIRWIFKKQN